MTSVLMHVDRIRQVMDAEGLDGLVASTLENVFYLSGVWHMGAELFPHDAEAYVVAKREHPDAGIVVVSASEADMITEAIPTIGGAITFGTFYREMPIDPSVQLTHDEQRVKEITLDIQPRASSFEALAAALEEAGLTQGVIGVDERGPNRGLVEALGARFAGLEIKPASQIFRRIRMVKTDDELVRMDAAMKAAEFALRKTLESVRDGVTERELYHVYERGITEAGARPGFTLIRFGKGMALGQVAPGDTQLHKGDYMWFDVGCTLNGYRTDIGRIIAFGEPGARLSSLHEAIKLGQDRAIELMTPGRLAREVFEGAVERVRESGIPHYKRHHVGHGIGVEYYDLPILTPKTEIPLEANMIFEVETPYYEFGFGGAFIEDTVLVGPERATIRTTLQRELQVIGA